MDSGPGEERPYWQRLGAGRYRRRSVLRSAAGAGSALSISALLAACGSSSSSKTATAGPAASGSSAATKAPAGAVSTAAAGGSPAAGAKPAAAPQLTTATLRVGIGSDAGSMDPMSLAGTGGGNWVNNIHFNGLIAYDPTTHAPYGDLLESFTPAADGKSWTAKLRAGITFHNGEAWDAATLKANMERATGAPSWDPKFASGVGAQFQGTLDSVEVVDPMTATFHMAQVDVAFPSKLTVPMIMPLKYLMSTDDTTLAAKPVGSGPFQFVSRTPDSEIRSTRFDKYFRAQGDPLAPRMPFIKDLVQTVIPQDQARVDALQAGNIDMAYNVPSDLAKSLQGQSGLKLVFLNGDQPMHIMINTTLQTDPDTGQPNPWLDARVRQAANMAIDLDTIISSLLTGHEKRSFGSSSVGFGFPKDITSKAYKYDPTGAKALLTQAGFPNGFKALLNYPTGRWPNTEAVTQAIAGYLTKVGIQTTLQPLQYQVVTTKLKEKSLYPLTFFGMAGGNDPEPNFYYGYTNNGIYADDPGGPALTQLVMQQQNETDPTKRAALIGQVITQFYTDARWIFLYEPITVVAMSNKWAYDPYFLPASVIDYWNVRPAS